MVRVPGLAVVALVACGGNPVPPAAPRPVAPDADAAVAPPGRVPETPEPTLRLPTEFAPTAYAARLAVDPAQPTFRGEIAIDGRLATAASVIWLHAVDLTIDAAEAEVDHATVALTPELRDGLVAFHAARDLPAGPVTLRVTYAGKVSTTSSFGVFAQQVDGVPYLLTQLEAVYARQVFPCFDEPSSKAPWTLTLDVPAGQTAIGNTPIASTEALADGGQRVHFATTRPLPTYLVAFAVGPWEMVDAGTTASGAPIRVATFAGQADRAAHAAATASTLIAALEDYFQIPYPYPKLDLVPIPATSSFGAMENAGLITFEQDLLLFDGAAPPTETRRFDWLAAHEMAHQWFGDLVTLSWWDDLWLNEAFATWMAPKVVATLPEWDPAEAARSRTRGLQADALATARRIRQPIETTDDIVAAFDGITYSKGASVIAMFERWVGFGAFRSGVHAYLADHTDGNADAATFLAAIDAHAPQPITAAFSTFLDQPGAPMLTATLVCGDGPPEVHLVQSRWLPPGAGTPAGDPPRWRLPVCVASGDGESRHDICGMMNDGTAKVPLADATCPTWFFPDAGGVGYYRVAMGKDDFAALVGAGWKHLTAAEQAAVVSDGNAMVAHGDLDDGAMLDLVPRLARGSRVQVDDALAVVRHADEVIADADRPALARWVRATFGARARKLGWLPGAHDSLDVASERAGLVDVDARIGEDQKLIARAVKLAARWRTLPVSEVAAVVGAAVRGKPSVGTALLAELDAVTDRTLHRELLRALAQTRDGELAAQLLARLLDPKVDLMQEQELVWTLAHRPLERQLEDFVRAHADELLARTPAEGQAWLLAPVVASCDAARRDDVGAWLTEHVAPLLAGQTVSAQMLETMDECIARRAAHGPAVAAWLAAHGKR